MATTAEFTERLFSYGTLQLESVQLATFGRRLDGHADVLHGYAMAMVKIDDPAVVATSGASHHPIVKFSCVPADVVAGKVFAITRDELAQADRYEVAAYKRLAVTLASSLQAWIYIDARYAPQESGVNTVDAS